MPKYSEDLRTAPRDHVKGGWPDGTLKRSAPAVAAVAQHIAIVLRDLTRPYGISGREAAKRAGMSQKALLNLLNGNTWPSMVTIARLEKALGVPLWDGRHHADGDVALEPQPRDYLLPGEWPTGYLDPSTPPEVDLAQKVAEALRAKMSREGFSSADVAAKTQVSEGTVNAILAGLIWPDLVTIARLERGLNLKLWLSQKGVARRGGPR